MDLRSFFVILITNIIYHWVTSIVYTFIVYIIVYTFIVYIHIPVYKYKEYI